MISYLSCFFFFFSSRRRHTRWPRDWSSDVCSSDLSSVAVSCAPCTRIPRGFSRAVEGASRYPGPTLRISPGTCSRSEEHTSELQSRGHLVCRLLLVQKKYEYQISECHTDIVIDMTNHVCM